MVIPLKVLKSGFSLPVLGFGTWQIGGRSEPDYSKHDMEIEAIRSAIRLGYSHIDTAEKYAGGHCEELVGKAIAEFPRERIVLASKFRSEHAKESDVLRACEKSLERLGVDFLDLYLYHAPNPEVPLRETMGAMLELLEKGLVKEIGVSNFSTKNLEAAQQCTGHRIVCNQVHYSLLTREPERTGLLEYCQENDVLLVAYRPVEKGKVAQEIPSVLKEVCEKYKKTPSQIAVNWLASQKNVAAIVMSRSAEHLQENIGGLDFVMETEDIERLRRDFPDQRAVSSVNPLQ